LLTPRLAPPICEPGSLFPPARLEPPVTSPFRLFVEADDLCPLLFFLSRFVGFSITINRFFFRSLTVVPLLSCLGRFYCSAYSEIPHFSPPSREEYPPIPKVPKTNNAPPPPLQKPRQITVFSVQTTTPPRGVNRSIIHPPPKPLQRRILCPLR